MSPQEKAMLGWICESRVIRTLSFKGRFISTASQIYPERVICSGYGETPEDSRKALAINGFNLGHW